MNGTQQVQCGKSVLKDSCSCCDGMNVSQLAEFDIVLKWNLLFLVISYFSFTLTIFFHPCFFQVETAETAKTVWNNREKCWIVKSHFKVFFVINTESLKQP